MPHAPRAAALFLVAGVLASACLPGAMKPPAHARAGRSTLAPGLGLGLAPAAKEGPLAVVTAIPQGETTGASEVTVVFNKPMRALTTPGKEAPVPVKLTPETKGRWEWVGTTAARFVPEEPLPFASEFRVEVPAGTRALDGSTLGSAFVARFSTPRPGVGETLPEQGAKEVDPEGDIRLDFTMPVTEAEVARAVSIQAARGKETAKNVAFVVGRDWKNPSANRFRVTPVKALPRDAEVVVRVDPSLGSAVGPLTAGKPHELLFHTVTPPRITKIACSNLAKDLVSCDTWSSIHISFSTAIDVKNLAKAIRIEPKVALNLDSYVWKGEAGSVDEIDLYGDFQTATSYTVTVTGSPAVRDDTGQALVGSLSQRLRFADHPATVGIRGSGTYWMAGEPPMLFLSATNMLHVSATAALLGHDDVLRRLVGQKVEGREGEPLAFPDARWNEHQSGDLDLRKLVPGGFEKGKRGLVLLRFAHDGRESKGVEERELQRTDVGIGTKIGPDSLLVWATKLSTGEPLPGATVEVLRVPEGAKEPALPEVPPRTVTADGRGVARVSLAGMGVEVAERKSPARSVAVVVRAGDDFAYRVLSVPRMAPPVGSVFTNRGLFRPGEVVGIKGLFRQPTSDGMKVPAGAVVHVKVRGQRREAPVAEWYATLSSFGTFDREVTLPKEGPTGDYAVEAELGEANIHTSFEVEEYRPTQIAVEARIDRPEYRRGETMICGVSGRFLSGGPLTGSGASVDFRRQPDRFTPKGLPKSPRGWVVSDDTQVTEWRMAQAGGLFDETGAVDLSQKLEMNNQSGPERVTCDALVQAPDGERLAASANALVHPGDYYVALEMPRDPRVLVGASLEPRVLAVHPDGTPASAKVKLELWKRFRKGYKEPELTPLTHCEVFTKPNEPVSCGLFVPRAAYLEYEDLVVRATSTDARGNPLSSSYALSPTEKIAPAPQPKKAEEGRRGISLSIVGDQERKVGDTLELDLHSPFMHDARAQIAIEREGVIWREEREVAPGDTTIRVPVTAEMIPNASPSVMLVDGAESALASAYWGFSVDEDPKRLRVKIETSTGKAEPGASVDVDVKVEDAEGKPVRGEVALFAADEASLSLTRFRTPDPLIWLSRHRADLVETRDTRDAIYRTNRLGGSHRSKAPQVRMGATQVSRPRSDFRQTVMFEPRLLTDASGHLRYRMSLPDALTTYRIMAVAIGADDRAGSAEAHVVATKKLSVRATLPRVVRTGDEVEAAVVVAGDELTGTIPAEVSVEATGVKLVGEAKRSVKLSATRPALLRFRLRAGEAGPMSFTARVAGAGSSDSMVHSAEVVTPAFLEAAALYGETSDAVAEKLGDLSAIRGDVGGLDVTLSPTPLAGLSAGMEQLLEYPYGCTEQTVSRMVPLLAVRELAEALGAKLPKDPTAALAASAERLSKHQRYDGGFGLWPGSQKSEPWLTAYALFGLGEAERSGIKVPPNVVARAVAYLEGTLSAASDPNAKDVELAGAAFTVDLLSEQGKRNEKAIAALFERRDRLTTAGQALLLHAVAQGPGGDDRRAELRRMLEATLRIDGAAARATSGGRSIDEVLDSDARTSALVLRALVALDAKHPLASKLALGLIADRKGGTWRTTQETAWALRALDAYRRANPPPSAGFEGRAFLGDALVAEASFDAGAPLKSVTVSLPASQLVSAGGEALTFAATAGGALHYEARLRFAPRSLPASPIDRGFYVTKRCSANGTDDTPSLRQLVAGETLRCRIMVVTPSPRTFVAIDDPLPGAFEVVNVSLRGGLQQEGWTGSSVWARSEIRDDRMLYFVDHLPAGVSSYDYLVRVTMPGRFVEPPTRAFEMYSPETFGRTGATIIDVRAP